MMRPLTRTLFAALLFAGLGAFAQQKQECYVINAAGQRQKAISIQADEKGDLKVNVDGKMTMPVKAGGYRLAVIPKPKEISDLEKLFEQEKYTEVISSARPVFEKYKWLGWADGIGALYCESLMAVGKNDEATQFYSEAAKYPRENNQKLQRIRMLDLLGKKQFDVVEQELKKMMMSKDDSLAAFAFNMRGQLNEAQGKKREAVLEYLKTVILFEGKAKLKRERETAKLRAVALLKELKDPRVAKIEAMK